jgi:hypothetical protein
LWSQRLQQTRVVVRADRVMIGFEKIRRAR